MLSFRLKSIFIILISLSFFLINTKYTDADIFAERNVLHNNFTISTMDFSAKSSVNNTFITNLFKTIDIVPNGFDLNAMKLKKEGTFGIKFRLKADFKNGDQNFCKSLKIEILGRKFEKKYEGSLENLSFESSLSDTNPMDLIFFLSLDNDDASLANKFCEFNLDFLTFRENSGERKGIYAERILKNTVISGNW
ncbi:MAG: hypothetical protein UT63_C0011G0008 [Candidatus Gottesmanbacteria bacterium GW2011_GWC2_39_8]|uniref:Uncharacterized protein n=1 Tax=Candidatus Gottesmanbacteria bacterium GW2011_GWC2_39_8 TaxID=1618450 RepID=A0A0G0Q917_9BACT|nr:MAG: hypothetical protein UT63_C0011G0008 [Candidatus Gottesmanbacteria bacterium GW2011_GWC2_39_8]